MTYICIQMYIYNIYMTVYELLEIGGWRTISRVCLAFLSGSHSCRRHYAEPSRTYVTSAATTT